MNPFWAGVLVGSCVLGIISVLLAELHIVKSQLAKLQIDKEEKSIETAISNDSLDNLVKSNNSAKPDIP